MIECPLGKYRRWQQSRIKYRSFFGTMTVDQAKQHLGTWPDTAMAMDCAIRDAWKNARFADHTALCALMQSGEWRK